MYNTPTAATAAALADYLRTKQLRALAYANYSALASIVSARIRQNPNYHPLTASDDTTRQYDATLKGYNLIDAEFKAAAAKALAVGVISWDEYKQALGA